MWLAPAALLLLFISANCQEEQVTPQLDLSVKLSEASNAARLVKNEIFVWQASFFAVQRYLDFEFDFAVTNVLHTLEQIQIPANITTAIRPTMETNRAVFNDRIVHLDKLLDAQRIKLDELDLYLYYPKTASVSTAIASLKESAQPIPEFYNSLKQAEADVLLQFLIEVKKALLDKVGPLADEANAAVREIESHIQNLNVAMEAAKVSHDERFAILEIIVNEILPHLPEASPSA